MTDVGNVWLRPLVVASVEHTLGHPDAPVSLVEYGSYDCPNCRAAHERIAQLRSYGRRYDGPWDDVCEAV